MLSSVAETLGVLTACPTNDMTLKTLARGRMCVNKIIAEPQRPGPRDTKQGGLRRNTIAFPQAKLELLGSTELPASPEEAARFMSNSVTIALAGADRNELHNAKWAGIPRGDYVDAACFCTAHNMAYESLTVNLARARELFAESGCTSDAVLQQAVPVVAHGELQHRPEGPAETGCGGTDNHEQVAAVDGVEVEECEEEGEEGAAADFNAALPDEEFPEAAMPTMHFCADDLTSGAMDEIQAIRKVHGELAELHRAVKEEAVEQGAAVSRASSLQHAVRPLLPSSVAMNIIQASSQAEAPETSSSQQPCEAYAIHTSSQPLSM